MILLASIIKTFKTAFLDQYQRKLLPSHRKALNAMARCRNDQADLMQASCTGCDHSSYLPHSCGHRACPHCQHHESQQWLERQLQKRVPAEYFLITFTLPAEFRPLAWSHQRIVYAALIQCAWDTLKSFSENDPQLRGIPGAIAVLHTHARNLDHHPHVHIVMPAAAIDTRQRLWRCKTHKTKKAYLFNHKALAKVFRAKLLAQLTLKGLTLPAQYPERWVVDCKSVGEGDKALVYLGRYLYRGVLPEKDIIACENGQVTYRYRESQSGEWRYKTLPGAEFLWRLLQHILPKHFRRARNFGFLHPNSKRLIQVIQLLFKIDPNLWLAIPQKRPAVRCPCCHEEMKFTRFRMPRMDYRRGQLLSDKGVCID